jgi:hypothetical protein
MAKSKRSIVGVQFPPDLYVRLRNAAGEDEDGAVLTMSKIVVRGTRRELEILEAGGPRKTDAELLRQKKI